MGNPYYIRPQDRVGQTADTLTRLYNIYSQGKQAAARNRLTEKEIDQRGRISAQQHEDRMLAHDVDMKRVSAMEKANEIARQKIRAGQAIHRQPFDPGRVQLLRSQFAIGGVDKAFEPVLSKMDEIAQNESVSRLDAYRQLSDPKFLKFAQKQVLDNLGKDYQKAAESGDMQRAEELANLMQGIGDINALKSSVDGLFRDTITSKGLEDQMAQAEIAKAQAAAMGEQWSQPYTDPYGNMVQRNMATGQVKKISSPDRNTVIRTTPDGGTEVVLGARGGGTDMQRGTRKTIEEKAINAQEGIARLNEIAQSYQPEFQQIDTRVKNAWTGLKDKLQGSPLEDWVGKATPEEKQQLEAFSAFKRDALSNINLYIKEITGAQMSEREAGRIRKAMPDPGEGLFDGDSPAEFESKWSRTMRSLKLANGRYVYYLKTAPEKLQSGEIMSLDRFKNRMADREEELREAGLGDQEIAVKLNEEFFSLGQ